MSLPGKTVPLAWIGQIDSSPRIGPRIRNIPNPGSQGFPECWRAQEHLTVVRLSAASVLDPTVPAETSRRKELLDQAAAILAPDKVAGRLTVDVQEALREIEHLRAIPVPPPR